jgi:glutamyl-tRNA reductase
MSLVVVGVNHRTGPLAVLERLAVPRHDLAKVVTGLVRRDHLREVVVLSTCGRTEIYAVAERFHAGYAEITEHLAAIGDLGLDELAPYLFVEHDDAAAVHLFEVAAGLDSAVIGETEILGQVRSAWKAAAAAGAARSSLDPLFRHALRVGKRARTETGISRGTTSISHAAVEMAAERLGPPAGRSVLVVGAGDMGRGVAAALRRSGAGEIVVANRTPARGAALAAAVDGSVVGFDDLGAAVARCDLAVACAPGDTHLTAELVGGARRDRPLLIVDIAVPRSVDPAVATLPGVTLLDLDDLRAWSERALSDRAADAEQVRAIVGEELERWIVDATARQAAPLVARLRDRAETIRAAEIDRYSSRLGSLGEAERDAVDALTRSIVAKLLHSPSIRLRADAGTPHGARNAAAVNDLFELDLPGGHDEAQPGDHPSVVAP